MNTSKKTALITGASRGLGKALAKALAAQGWKLILTARGQEALQNIAQELAQYTEVQAIPGDIADSKHRLELYAALQKWAALDLLVNNASQLGPSPQPSLLDYDLESLEKVYQTNLIAPLGVIQTAANFLSNQSIIINLSSDAGVEAYPGWGGYGSSKAALDHLSAILAAENPHWKVYWVDPGDMQTQMHQAAFPGEDISDRPLPESSVPGLLQLISGQYPSGRYQARSPELISRLEVSLR